MPRKVGKLICCRVCMRPLILWEGVLDEKSRVQFQGPMKQPAVRSWCGGHCETFTIPMTLEIESLARLARQARTKNVKALARVMRKRLIAIRKEQDEDLLSIVRSFGTR